MPRDADQYDFFVSYARKDNEGGWITGFIEELLAEHKRFTGGRELVEFFDKDAIRSLDDWQNRIYDGLSASRLFLAFVSPNYFASEWCRREWRLWIDVEIAKHILSDGAAPIYIVKVPGYPGEMSEDEIVRGIAEVCGVKTSPDDFAREAAPILNQIAKRQLNAVQPFYDEGLEALRSVDLRKVLEQLAHDVAEKVEYVRKAALSKNYKVPVYNERFTGRLEELQRLRNQLQDRNTGVVTGIHGLGGIGKTELALTYSWAFAGMYPGGRFYVACEGRRTLRDAIMQLGDAFINQTTEEERQTPDTHFDAICRCLQERIEQLGRVLILLDNVTDTAILSPEQTDELTWISSSLHLLATTRMGPPPGEEKKWLTLGELPEADAIELLEKCRSTKGEEEWIAAQKIVRRLGCFTLAVELTGAYLKAHPGVSYVQMAEHLGLEDLEGPMAKDADAKLIRHNHQRGLKAILAPMLESLSPAELRALEYASLLAPDVVPLSWLKELAVADFPELAERKGITNPWDDLWRKLTRLTLLVRTESDNAGYRDEPRVVRMHRLVQEIVWGEVPEEKKTERSQSVSNLVKGRDAVLEGTTNWTEGRWEVEPLEELAVRWDEEKHEGAAWLLNQVGFRWYGLAEYTRAERLMRRGWPSGSSRLARVIPTSPPSSTTSRSCSRPRTASPRPSR